MADKPKATIRRGDNGGFRVITEDGQAVGARFESASDAWSWADRMGYDVPVD